MLYQYTANKVMLYKNLMLVLMMVMISSNGNDNDDDDDQGMLKSWKCIRNKAISAKLHHFLVVQNALNKVHMLNQKACFIHCSSFCFQSIQDRFTAYPEIATDAVLSLDEDSYLLTDEVHRLC